VKELRTEIEIDAPAEYVWEVLTDFASYPKWNPFIRRVDGEARTGAVLDAYIQPSGGRGMSIKPHVLKVEPGRELRWRGRLFLPGIFTGEHIFMIDGMAANRVRFTQREVFTGLLVPFLGRMIEEDTRRGFDEMNAALKNRVEQGGHAEPDHRTRH